MNIIVLGGKGYLGSKVIDVITRESIWKLWSVEYGQEENMEEDRFNTLDIRKWKSWMQMKSVNPDIIINAAAITDVNKCETKREIAWQNNVHLVEIVGEICRAKESKLIQLSSDYVFDGKNGPYREDNLPNPINYYGKTKLAAENICRRGRFDVAIIRTMWLYGENNGSRQTFMEWLVSKKRSGEHVGVVDDEWGNPTYIGDVALSIVKTIETGVKGIVHVAGDEYMTRFDFAKKILASQGLEEETLERIKSGSLASRVQRPLVSGLINMEAKMKLGFKPSTLNQGLEMSRVITLRKESKSARYFEKK